MKIVLWRVAKHLSYIEDARCLKVNVSLFRIPAEDLNIAIQPQISM